MASFVLPVAPAVFVFASPGETIASRKSQVRNSLRDFSRAGVMPSERSGAMERRPKMGEENENRNHNHGNRRGRTGRDSPQPQRRRTPAFATSEGQRNQNGASRRE